MPMLVRAIKTFRQIEASIVDRCFLARAHRLNRPPVGTEVEPGGPHHYDHKNNESERENVHTNLVAAASAATATAATTRESSRWFRRGAITGTIRRAENRKLNRVLLTRALRAGNLLRLVQHNLLKVRLAILTDVFVNWHIPILMALLSIIIAHHENDPSGNGHT